MDHIYAMDDLVADVYYCDSSRTTPPDYARNLAKGYNEVMKQAFESDAELLVTLQDYIWIPRDGLQRFLAASRERPDVLWTGLCDHASGPDVGENPGLWTVFDEPWDGEKPDYPIQWKDIRVEEVAKRGVDNTQPFACEPGWWEANWGAIPFSVYDAGVRFSEDYDKGVAYENQDFAMEASVLGFDTWVDPNNVSISLPHKRYFPELEAADLEKSNLKMHHEKWMLDMPTG
jgi:hypothetical protein